MQLHIPYKDRLHFTKNKNIIRFSSFTATSPAGIEDGYVLFVRNREKDEKINRTFAAVFSKHHVNLYKK